MDELDTIPRVTSFEDGLAADLADFRAQQQKQNARRAAVEQERIERNHQLWEAATFTALGYLTVDSSIQRVPELSSKWELFLRIQDKWLLSVLQSERISSQLVWKFHPTCAQDGCDERRSFSGLGMKDIMRLRLAEEIEKIKADPWVCANHTD